MFFFSFSLQMVQAIQVLRFHLLELEKVSDDTIFIVIISIKCKKFVCHTTNQNSLDFCVAIQFHVIPKTNFSSVLRRT